MARGFDSKSVEEQQSESQRQKELGDKSRKKSPAEIARETARRGLQLQISRIEQQLAAATNDRHRSMLDSALADLKQQLAAL